MFMILDKMAIRKFQAKRTNEQGFAIDLKVLADMRHSLTLYCLTAMRRIHYAQGNVKAKQENFNVE